VASIVLDLPHSAACRDATTYQPVLADDTLLRGVPRRVDFRTLTQDDFDAIAQELNERPRLTLGFKTSSQALAVVLR
jgi:hypothetical protein